MEKNKKIGLIIMGGCTVLLLALLLVLGGSKPAEEQTEENAYPDMAEGTATPVKDSKSEAYLTGDPDRRESNTKKHWDDCGQMLEQKEKERLEAGDLLLMEDDMLLMETSTVTPPFDLKGSLSSAMSAGYRPLFAHPERCRFLEAKDYDELASMGVLFQLNIASLTGYYGGTAKAKSENLLKKGMYSVYGSDCHRVRSIKEQYSRPELNKEILKKLVTLYE